MILTKTLVPVIQAAQYASGNCLGTVMSMTLFALPGSGAMLVTVQGYDKANQKAPFDVLLFSAAPAGTYADKTAADISAADAVKLVGRVTVNTGDYTTIASSSEFTTVPGLVGLQGAGTTSLWVLLVIRGTATYAGTSDIGVHLTFLRDEG